MLITPRGEFCVRSTWFAFQALLCVQRGVFSQVGGSRSARPGIKPEADEGRLPRVLQGRRLSDCQPRDKSCKIKQVLHAMFI